MCLCIILHILCRETLYNFCVLKPFPTIPLYSNIVRRLEFLRILCWKSNLYYYFISSSIPGICDARHQDVHSKQGDHQRPQPLSSWTVPLLQLFERNPSDRLGMPGCQHGPIKSQPFFRNMDWDKLESRQIAPPFKPKIVSFIQGLSINRVVFHQGGLSSGWSFIRVVYHQGGLSSGSSIWRVVFHQVHLSSGLSFIRVVCHVGCLSGWSFVRVVFHQGDLSSG